MVLSPAVSILIVGAIILVDIQIWAELAGVAFAVVVQIAVVVRDRRVALWAALLISLGGNSIILDRPDPVSGFPLNFMLHVPFHTISLGTAQSLGWVFFLPCLSLSHLSYRSASTRWAIVSPGPAAHSARSRSESAGRSALLPFQT